MAWSGCIDGVLDGDPRDAILAVRAFIVGNAIKVVITPNPWGVGTFYAVWINGVWQGPNSKAPLRGDIEGLYTFDPGTDVGSIWIEQVGIAETFDPSFVPSEYAEAQDALTANRLRIKWTAPYGLTPVNGDSQLSAITVTGALRNVNVDAIEDAPYRGRLSYTISTVGTTHFVRWYAGGKLVAAGERIGNGAVTCAAVNSSGLTITCTLTYTAAVTLGTAQLDVVWDESYEIHYGKETVSNYLLWSEDLTHAPWANDGTAAIVTADQADAPDGTHTADQVSITGDGYYYQAVTPLTHGAYTVSIWLKGTAGQQLDVVSYDYITPWHTDRITFTGAWQQVSITRTADGLQLYLMLHARIFDVLANPAALPPTTFYAWGGQINGGANIQRYVPTTNVARTITALNFPRAAQATVQDNGQSSYKYRSPALAAGDYDFNVRGVDDAGGNKASLPPAASGTPKTINSPPAAPTITSVTGNAGTGGLTAHWTNGEAGCTTKLYYALDGPINYGQLTAPAPIGPSAVNATSALMPTFATPGYDNTADYAAVAADIDTAIGSLSIAFDAGETGFLAAVDTATAAVATTLDAYETALDKRLQSFKEIATAAGAHLRSKAVQYNGAGLSASDWTIALTAAYSQYIALLGEMINGDPNRYALPDGTLPGTLLDGTTGIDALGSDTLLDAGTPLVRNSTLRMIARATKGGVEELTDTPFIVELKSDGSIVAARPATADIQDISSFDETFNVTAGVTERNGFAPAASVEILIDGVAAASAALPAVGNGYHGVAIAVTVTTGWHSVAARSITAGGVRSEDVPARSYYFGGTYTEAVEDLEAEVIRGLGQ